MSNEQQADNDPSSWVKYMPAWLKALIATAAGLSLFFAFVPREAIREAVSLMNSPGGTVLLYMLGIAATMFVVYKIVELRIKELTEQVMECREHHRACEAKQRQLTGAVLDFIHGDTDNAIATVKKLLSE